MKPDEIRDLYDRAYAATYEEYYLHDAKFAPDTEHERRLIADLLSPNGRWLDVACGTGYFLSHFPSTTRVGLDLSPAMLERARAANPGADFVEADFREPRPHWEGAFDLVSCMWYAYTLVDTIGDIETLVGNLASWTSSAGRCFVPLADPELIAGVELPYVKHAPAQRGTMTITGILWSYSEDNDTKVHRHMVVPAIDYMKACFERYFTDVAIVRYPAVNVVSRRAALIASGKRGV